MTVASVLRRGHGFDPYRLPNLELALDAGNSGPSSNILSNSTFDTDLSGWVNYQRATPVVRDTTNPISGAASVYVTTGGGIYTSFDTNQSWKLDTSVETTCYVSFDFKTDGTLTNAPEAWCGGIGVGAPYSVRVLPKTQLTPARFSLSFSMLKRTDNDIWFYINDQDGHQPVVAGEHFWVDNVSFVLSRPQDGGAVAQWNDLSGKGRHVIQADATKQPLFRNANRNLLSYNQATFEGNITGDASITAGNGAGAVIVTSTDFTQNGMKSLKYTAGPTPSTDSGPQIKYSFIAGTQYTVSAYVYMPVIVGTGLNLDVYNGTWVGGRTKTTAVVGAWTRLSLTFVAGVTSLSPIAPFAIGTPPAGSIWYVDSIQVETGGVATQWVAPVTLPNNLPTVQFDGLNDFLQSVSFDSPLAQPLTIYAVKCSDIAISSTAVVIDGQTSQGNVDRVIPISLQNSLYQQWATSYLTSGLVDNKTTDVICSFIQNTTSFMTRNGVKGTVGNPGPNNWGGYTLGRYAGVSDLGNLAGGIAAILVFSEAHSDATRKRIEKWLGNKYGIAIAP